jgi:uncharacterized protein with NRDE domain
LKYPPHWANVVNEELLKLALVSNSGQRKVIMCLIVLAYRVHPDYPIVIAANRDEFYDRPTLALDDWSGESNIVAGRDLEGGGTWMGIHRNGRLAALTNYREPGVRIANAPSRGHLVSDFLQGNETLDHYLNKIKSMGPHYNGFNLILSEGRRWVYYSNRGGAPQELQPGVYGLSNHLLDTPWPKVAQSCRAMKAHLSSQQPPGVKDLLEMLQDRSVPPDADLPHTGVGLEWERRLGAVFIHSDIYGTRSSTVLLVASDGTARVCERTFDRGGFVGEVDRTLRLPDGPAGT